MDQAGVLADPAQPGEPRQVALEDGGAVDEPSGLDGCFREADERLGKPDELFESGAQDVVIVRVSGIGGEEGIALFLLVECGEREDGLGSWMQQSGMSSQVEVAAHIGHFAVAALVEPVLEVLEVGRRAGGDDCGELEADAVGEFDELLVGGHGREEFCVGGVNS